ncbi:hypothetical protein D3C72_2072150 [compost metagenome]
MKAAMGGSEKSRAAMTTPASRRIAPIMSAMEPMLPLPCTGRGTGAESSGSGDQSVLGRSERRGWMRSNWKAACWLRRARIIAGMKSIRMKNASSM